MAISEEQLAAGVAYRELLLGALGEDDPARAAAATPARMRALIDSAGADLRTRPAPGEWSVLLCVAHLADAELVWSGRYRFVLAHDRPDLPGYDQDLFIDRLHADDDDPSAHAALFEALRTSNLELWRRATPEMKARIGLHGERGPESFELMFRMIAGHDRVHLDQAERALQAVRSR